MPPLDLLTWTPLLLIVITVLEVLPPYGRWIPGQVFVIAGGAVAALGYVGFGAVVLAATAGAFIGDHVVFLMGQRDGPFYHRHRHVPAKATQRVEALLDHSAFAGIVFGRFATRTRALAPLIAGANGMDSTVFTGLNVISAIVWSIAFAGLGFGLGLLGATYGTTAVLVALGALGALDIIVAASRRATHAQPTHRPRQAPRL